MLNPGRGSHSEGWVEMLEKSIQPMSLGGGREGCLWASLGRQGRLLEVVSSLENQMDVQLLRLVRERAPRCRGMDQMGMEFYRTP